MAAPIDGNTAVAVLHQEEHLPVPSVGVQGPAMRESYDRTFSPVFVVNRCTVLDLNRAHVVYSLSDPGRRVVFVIRDDLRLARLRNGVVHPERHSSGGGV